MGFKEFYLMNLAFLAKQAWRIIVNAEALWVKFLRSINFPEDEFLRAKKKGGASWIWSSILKGRELLLNRGKWVVGNGKSIGIWQDN